MPLVIVTTCKLPLDSHYYLARDLQLIVAEALDAPSDEGGQLQRDEIEVRFREIGPHDVNSSPFGVVILANDFPSRRANIDYRVDRIARALRVHPCVPRSVIDDQGGFVWVLLAPGAFRAL